MSSLPPNVREKRKSSFFDRFKRNKSVNLRTQPATTIEESKPVSTSVPATIREERPTEKTIGPRLLQRRQATPIEMFDARKMQSFRELVRKRYRLDVEIWQSRKEKEHMRDRLKENMVKSDAVLQEILSFIRYWDRRECFVDDEEYQLFLEIKSRMLGDGKRIWSVDPPWKDPKDPPTTPQDSVDVTAYSAFEDPLTERDYTYVDNNPEDHYYVAHNSTTRGSTVDGRSINSLYRVNGGFSLERGETLHSNSVPRRPPPPPKPRRLQGLPVLV